LTLATFMAREAGEVTRASDDGESLRAEVMDEEVLAGAVMAAAAGRWDREGSAVGFRGAARVQERYRSDMR
jgi:hypothetical protein